MIGNLALFISKTYLDNLGPDKTKATTNTALLPAVDKYRQLNNHPAPPAAMLYRCALFSRLTETLQTDYHEY